MTTETRYLSIPKAQELAAALMADEQDGWDFVAVIVDHARGIGEVRVYDNEGNYSREFVKMDKHTVYKDDRNDEQRKTHRWIVSGIDTFMSGWGGAAGGKSVAGWACDSQDAAYQVERWVRSRTDILDDSIAVSLDDTPKRRGVAHEHVYVVNEGHPALRR